MKLLNIIRKARRKLSSYEPLITVEISRQNILHNLKTYQALSPETRFAPVLKSNAYGHGLVPVASILDSQPIAFFVVDSLYEAGILRNNGIQSDILVIGYTTPNNILANKLPRVAFTITSLEQLQQLNVQLQRPQTFHIKVDTGMHRQGLLVTEVNEALRIVTNNSRLRVEGVCSHFADADGETTNFTEQQIAAWHTVARRFKEQLSQLKYTHLSNTAGSDLSATIEANTIRLGLGLYGINASPRTTLNLQPALSMKTIITSVRTIEAGERVGYNLTYTAAQPSRIATVPVGYFEGVDRCLSNIGSFKIGDQICPIVGRVSMNISSCDVSKVQNVKIGDEVTIISSNPTDKNSVEQWARLCQTIPWEILIHIPEHLRRTIV